jgi:hypothetical protein
MNDQIKELAESAGFQSYYKHGGNLGWVGDAGTLIPKFAELIVKECIDCVDDLIEPDPYNESIEGIYREHNRALKQAMDRIAKRFGVEV